MAKGKRLSHKARVAWLPKPYKAVVLPGGRIWRKSGEPNVIELDRFGNDTTLRGDTDVKCCDCGLRHLYTFEIYKAPNGQFYMTNRAYRMAKD